MKLLMISLGCDKNLVDSEMMMGTLSKEGFTFTDDEEDAEVIIVNSCCFIGDAKEESINTILQMAEYKVEKGGKCRALIVCGCLAQRYSQEIREEIPEVDGVIGTASIDEIVSAINEIVSKDKKPIIIKSLDKLPQIKDKRILSTGGHYAYLKIADGCEKHCTYCIIPKLRGIYKSFPMDSLIMQAKELVESGVKELILVAQETTLYGIDLYGKKSLPELINKLSEIEDLEWIRILYAYPEEIDDELIDTIASTKKVCHYIDMPIQSGSDSVLKRMGRRTTSEEIMALVEKLRNRIPDICIRTTLIAGFPGESQEDQEATLEFINKVEFDRLGVFTYSLEEDTPAANFPDQIDDDEKENRRNQLMELQQEIVFERNEKLIGKELDVFIEGKIVEDDTYVGRTYMDAPGVDGYIFVQSDRELMSGMMITAKVTGANDYDLIGELIS